MVAWRHPFRRTTTLFSTQPAELAREGTQGQPRKRHEQVCEPKGDCETQACPFRTHDLRICTGVRRDRLEGPKRRRAAKPINRLGLPVKRIAIKTSHGTSFRKMHYQDAMNFFHAQLWKLNKSEQ